MENFPSPIWKGFYSLSEATDAARAALGPNYFISQRTVELSISQSVGGVSLNPSLTRGSSSNPSSSSKIDFCDHCETMVKNFKILNERCRQGEEEIAILQEQLRYFKGKKPAGPPKKPYPDTDGSFEAYLTREKHHKIIVPISKPMMLSYLPPDLRNHIYSKAKDSGSQFHEFLFDFLSQLACRPVFPLGISFTWDCHYDTSQRTCPQEDPYCITIPLERDVHYKCHLVYSIPRVCIDLQHFEPLSTKYQGNDISITVSTLLDYGFLRQLLFSDPDDTDCVGRKLAVCVNKLFVDGSRYVDATI